MGGRDPITGRKIIGRWGGGSKWKYRWIDWQRLPGTLILVVKISNLNFPPKLILRYFLINSSLSFK